MSATRAATPSVFKIVMVRLRFLLIFVAIGLIVGNWSWIMAQVDRWTRPHTHEPVAGSDIEWYCPMHPSVVRAEEAKCPICGMGLSKRKKSDKSALPAEVLARLTLSSERVVQAGVAVEEVVYRPLSAEVRAVGVIDYDERRFTDLSVRVAGRVDELFVNFEGSRVRAGDPLYRIYSPDLVSTQEELLLSLKTLEELRAKPQHEASVADRAQRLAESARQRLLLWGVSETQLEELTRGGKAGPHLTVHSPVSGLVTRKNINAGRYVQLGEDPYTVVDDSAVWVFLEIFERDLGLVSVGQAVEIASEAFPGEVFRGQVTFLQPEIDPETRTLRVRVEVDNGQLKLRRGMYVTGVIQVPLALLSASAGAADLVGVPAEAIHVCEMHREEAFLKPGACEKCGGMTLEEHKLPPGSRLAYSCPDHPRHVQTSPGKCPIDGKDLEYRVLGKEELEGAVLTVPVSAIVDSGGRKVAFLEKEGGIYDAVDVLLGPRGGGYFQVLRGLKAGDRVVAAGAFLLDAATRLNPAARAAFFGASGHEGHEGHK
jgi:Cu(I)/Ag(I) efflux system membrane fusion protein